MAPPQVIYPMAGSLISLSSPTIPPLVPQFVAAAQPAARATLVGAVQGMPYPSAAASGFAFPSQMAPILGRVETQFNPAGGAVPRRPLNAGASYRCIPCSRDFATQDALNAHQRVHASVRCDKCGLTLPLYQSYLVHMRLEHAKKYKCLVCGKIDVNPLIIVKHILDHKDMANIAKQVYRYFAEYD